MTCLFIAVVTWCWGNMLWFNDPVSRSCNQNINALISHKTKQAAYLLIRLMQVTTETLKCPDICYRCCWCSGGRSLSWRQSEERTTSQMTRRWLLCHPFAIARNADLFDWQESHLWWFKGIVRGEVDGKEEHASLIRTVSLKDKSGYSHAGGPSEI